MTTKKYAKASAPVAPKPASPPPVWREYLVRRLESRSDSPAVEKFLAKAAEDFIHAFEWDIEEALTSAHQNAELKRVLAFVTTPRMSDDGKEEPALPTDERIVEMLRSRKERIEAELLGDGLGRPTSAPWLSQSTSWATNVSRAYKSNADRQLRFIYADLIEAYEARARFDAAMAANGAGNASALLAEAGFPNWTEADVKMWLTVKRDLEAAAKRAELDAKGEAAVAAIRAENAD